MGRSFEARVPSKRRGRRSSKRSEVERHPSRWRTGEVRGRRETEDRFKRLLRAVRVIPWEADVYTGDFVYIGPQIEEIFGFPQEVWYEGQFWERQIHPDDRNYVVAYCNAAIFSRSNYEIEYRMISADERIVWIRDIVAVTREDGQPVLISGYMVDITAQKTTEEELRQSEERFRLLSETAFEAIFVHEQGRILFSNLSGARLFGYASSELVGRPVLDLAAPESRELVQQKIREESEEPYEAQGMRKNGERFIGEVRGRKTVSHGRSVRIVTIYDITEFKKVENSLREAQASLHEILNSAPVVFFVLDQNGIFTMSEGKGLTALGLRPGQVLGRSVFEIYADEPGIVEHARRALRGEEFLAVDEVRRLDLIWETRWSPVRNGNGRMVGALGVATNVTDRERAEAERDRLLKEAREALLKRDEFISLAAHELRTPLTSLTMQIHLIDQLIEQVVEQWEVEKIAPEKLRQLIGLSKQQLERFGILINNLLDVSRIAHGPLVLSREQVDLTGLIRSVIKRFSVELIETGCSVVERIDEGLTGIWDPQRLDQVVTNLLTNAMKFGVGKPIEIAAIARGEKRVISVRDHGIGISAEEQSRIFERFARGKASRRFGGLGLGLYITRQIVEAHGGVIWVESEPGKGALFTVELPVGKSEVELGSSL